MHTIENVGPIIGIASFVAFSALVVLYVLQARRLRELKRRAGFLVDRPNGAEGGKRRRRAAGG